jgi:hypothetical protein
LPRQSIVTFPSRIFYRSAKKVKRDPDFARAVAGQEAIKRLKAKLPLLSKTKLTYEQKIELKEGVVCPLPGNKEKKEQTHGLIQTDEGIRWSCRCENRDCSHFQDCMSDRFAMEILRREKLGRGESAVPAFSYPALGIAISIQEEMLALLDPQLSIAPAPKKTYEELRQKMPLKPSERPSASAMPQQGESLPEGMQSPSPLGGAEEGPRADPSLSASERLSATPRPQQGERLPEEMQATSPFGGLGSAASIGRQADQDGGDGLDGEPSARPPLPQERAAQESLQPAAESPQAEFPMPVPPSYRACSEEDAVAHSVETPLALEGAAPDALIARYAHVASQGDIKKGNILLVCQSLVTKERLVRKAASMGMDISTNFATYDTMPPLGSESIHYVIACEIESAEATGRDRLLAFASAARCPYTLLGDRYFRMPREKGRRDFYARLDRALEGKAALFRLENRGNPFSEALASGSEKMAQDAFAALPRESETGGRDRKVWLLQTEGHAAAYSGELWNRGVSNRILGQAAMEPIGRWLADMFWDIRTDDISFGEFAELYEYRVAPDERRAREVYSALISSYALPGMLRLSALSENPQKFPPYLKGDSAPASYVASLKEASPFRFEEALIAFEPESAMEGAYAGYSAYIIGSGRCAAAEPVRQKGMKALASGRHCTISEGGFASTIQLGLPSDVDGSYYGPSNPRDLDLQSYIGRRVHEGDSVALEQRGGHYAIIHGEREIGRLSQPAELEIASLAHALRLEGACVSDVATYISAGAFRLGVRLGGVATAAT